MSHDMGYEKVIVVVMEVTFLVMEVTFLVMVGSNDLQLV